MPLSPERGMLYWRRCAREGNRDLCMQREEVRVREVKMRTRGGGYLRLALPRREEDAEAGAA